MSRHGGTSQHMCIKAAVVYHVKDVCRVDEKMREIAAPLTCAWHQGHENTCQICCIEIHVFTIMRAITVRGVYDQAVKQLWECNDRDEHAS